MSAPFDAVIIGAGMSGLAAGIRLSMYQKRVCILEKHTVPGGLNSYYQRGKRQFDVGLHALTNFSRKDDRRNPLNRLLRQLRLSYDDLKLQEQRKSKILFPQGQLSFSNDFRLLMEEVAREFPGQVDGFARLVNYIKSYNELDLNLTYESAKEKVGMFISDPLLVEMIFCPLLIYGSAWEMDMDFAQFVVMFKSIFLQGFSRPKGGVRTIINLLLEKFRQEGGELRYGAQVEKIHVAHKKIRGVELASGEFIPTDCLISSMGYPETMSICTEPWGRGAGGFPRIGKLTFTEAIMMTERKAFEAGMEDTIVFYNNRSRYKYQRPVGLVDSQSAVVCCPNNFGGEGEKGGEGILRVTLLANMELWKTLEKSEYRKEKEKVFDLSLEILKNCYPGFSEKILFKDVFTPKTILRYTGHFDGVVYGSPDKTRNGKTPYQGIYICGTDQGFLGIVGAMLSGITVANLYGLIGSE